MEATPRSILTGLVSYIPKAYSWLYTATGGGGGGTKDPKYCLEGWLTHALVAFDLGLPTPPKHIAEIGPGMTLGTGLCGLLCGAESFRALDIIPYSTADENVRIFEKLVEAFERGANFETLPDFPQLPLERLDDVLGMGISPNRKQEIREALYQLDHPLNNTGSLVRYHAPWMSKDIIEPESVDFIFSNAVLEHVEDLDALHTCAYKWLAPGGHVLHRIDFSSHGTAKSWNGHWTISKPLWKIIRGKRPYSINRKSLSDQKKALSQAGFHILGQRIDEQPTTVTREMIDKDFDYLTDEDLLARQAFVLCRK